MAGFRLWERIGIEDLLDHLTRAALDEVVSEECRAKPWSRLSAAWGLVAQADLELEKKAPRERFLYA